MKRYLLFSILLVLAVSSEGLAARPRGFFFRARGPEWQVRRAPSYDETYRYLNWRYPKYVGGFHASYFRDLGVPPGDVGLRGNGLYMTPW